MHTTPEHHIVLVGDSTLDNIVWVEGQHATVAQQIINLLKCRVTNYAADGFTSQDVMRGAVPNISLTARRNAGDPFPALGVDKIFKPLDHLEKSDGVSHIVLSVGGNDVREILGHLQELPTRLAGFLTNYPAILNRSLKVTPRVIIMLQYRPSRNHDGYNVYSAMSKLTNGGDAVETLNALMEEIYPPILTLAKEHKLAVIDLPNTFDIYNNDLYRCQIEPSQKGGQIIADLISHVVNNHDWEGPSRFYFQKEGENKSKINEGTGWVIEPKDETSRMFYNQLIQTILKQGTDITSLVDGNDDDDDEVLVTPNLIAQVEAMGFTDKEKIIRCLQIDGTIETAIAALFSQ